MNKPELFRSAHQHIEYYPEYSLIKRVLMGQLSHKDWPEQQQDWLEYAGLIRTYKPRNVLVNARQYDFLPGKDIQEWINYHVVSAYNEVKLEKWAMVIPPQFLQQVAIEQTIEANPRNEFEVRYFESEYDALQWILGHDAGNPSVE